MDDAKQLAPDATDPRDGTEPGTPSEEEEEIVDVDEQVLEEERKLHEERERVKAEEEAKAKEVRASILSIFPARTTGRRSTTRRRVPSHAAREPSRDARRRRSPGESRPRARLERSRAI